MVVINRTREAARRQLQLDGGLAPDVFDIIEEYIWETYGTVPKNHRQKVAAMRAWLTSPSARPYIDFMNGGVSSKHRLLEFVKSVCEGKPEASFLQMEEDSAAEVWVPEDTDRLNCDEIAPTSVSYEDVIKLGPTLDSQEPLSAPEPFKAEDLLTTTEMPADIITHLIKRDKIKEQNLPEQILVDTVSLPPSQDITNYRHSILEQSEETSPQQPDKADTSKLTGAKSLFAKVLGLVMDARGDVRSQKLLHKELKSMQEKVDEELEEVPDWIRAMEDYISKLNENFKNEMELTKLRRDEVTELNKRMELALSKVSSIETTIRELAAHSSATRAKFDTFKEKIDLLSERSRQRSVKLVNSLSSQFEDFINSKSEEGVSTLPKSDWKPVVRPPIEDIPLNETPEMRPFGIIPPPLPAEKPVVVAPSAFLHSTRMAPPIMLDDQEENEGESEISPVLVEQTNDAFFASLGNP